MVIGISPEYNYPGKLEEWKQNNTFYASNFGASLITRSLMKIFDGDYISDFSDFDQLNEQYDLCVLAFATHITSWRDVSFYSNIVEKLDMPVLAPSLGVQDYSQSSNEVFKLHPSLVRLLDIVSERSQWIGVRGPFTASILYKNGYNQVLPVGCPSLQSNLVDNIQIKKKASFQAPVIVYQQNIARNGYKLMQEAPILGQDFIDEVVFTDQLDDDLSLKKMQEKVYNKFSHKEHVLKAIEKNGHFPANYEDWFQTIGEKDFVVGTRLHGVFAGLLRNIPSVLIPRDIRTKEISEFYQLPTVKIDHIEDYSLEKIYEEVDFETFNKTYKKRYRNFFNFLEENKVRHRLAAPSEPGSFEFSIDDFSKIFSQLSSDRNNMEKRLLKVEKLLSDEKGRKNGLIKETIKKIPFAKNIAKAIRNQ